jgi:acyl-CoA reductase-like NAD-dependent aldehyde dehydrogenase
MGATGAAGQRCMAISVAVFVGESAQLLRAVKAKAAALKVGWAQGWGGEVRVRVRAARFQRMC